MVSKFYNKSFHTLFKSAKKNLKNTSFRQNIVNIAKKFIIPDIYILQKPSLLLSWDKEATLPDDLYSDYTHYEGSMNSKRLEDIDYDLLESLCLSPIQQFSVELIVVRKIREKLSKHGAPFDLIYSFDIDSSDGKFRFCLLRDSESPWIEYNTLDELSDPICIWHITT